MKTRIVLIAIFSIFIFWGCQKETVLDPIIDPVPVEKYITVTASAGVGGAIDPSGITQLKLGTTKIYTVSPSTGYSLKSVKVNGLDLNLSNNTFEVKADVLVDKDIKVEFVSDKFLFLTKNVPYYFKGYKIFQDGKLVDEPILDPKSEGDTYFFTPEGRSKVYDKNGVLFGNNPWSFKDNNGLVIGSLFYTIITLTEKDLIITTESFYSYKPAVYQYFYFRL